jgi:hypothetical protein
MIACGMRTLTQQQPLHTESASTWFPQARRAASDIDRRPGLLRRSPGGVVDEPAQRALQSQTPQTTHAFAGASALGTGHDLSRIPIYPGASAIQTKLARDATGDAYEQEADRMAEQVTRVPQAPLAPTCECGGTCEGCRSVQPNREAERLQMKRIGSGMPERSSIPPIIHEVLRSPGQPLEPATRAGMEQRFGHDFSGVRVHTDSVAARSAETLAARAYTVRHHVVFGTGRYAPASREGRSLLAHELTHVVQQQALAPSTALVQRQPLSPSHGMDTDVVAEREYGGSGAPKAQTCGRPSWCPPGFCDPYRSAQLAEYYRHKKAWWLMAGISAAVNSRVVPLWREYLWGGSSPKNLSAEFGQDFTDSPTTKKTTTFLYDELKKSIAASPPTIPLYSTTSVDLVAQIPKAVAALGDPASADQMNFNIPKDIPGNLAGGVGKDQKSCPSGAQPSPFDDERHASGIVMLTRSSPVDLTVTPVITYSVKDTIDLCPGDCGTTLEQVATVALSQFEATGISGDVPFTVEFAAPALGSFTLSAPLSGTASPGAKTTKP